MSGKAIGLWSAYAVFVGCALFLNWHESLFDFSGRLGFIKLGVWATVAGFLAYSLYCSSREDLFQSLRKITAFQWGRQITIDLYLGLMIALFIIFLNEGALVAFLWALPLLAFANLAMLLYIAIHFDSIVTLFLG